MLFSLWNNFRGYAIIRFEGVGLERLLNRCEAQGIPIWDIRRTGRMSMRAKVPYLSLRKIMAIAAKNKCTVEVDGRRGLLPRLAGLLQKKVFLLCAIISLAAIVAFTQFVWIIEINGEEVAVADISARLEGMQITQGTRWVAVDELTLQRELMLHNENAARVMVNRQGVKLQIDIIPLEAAPEYIENTIPCDIVASIDGVIISATALDGVPLVHRGQTVKKGDILIKGEFSTEESGHSRTVAARGEVLAKVWHHGTARIPANEVKREPTGREHTIRRIIMGGWEIEVDPLPGDFGDYIIDTESRSNLSSLFLPAYVQSTHVKEVNVVLAPRQYTLAENEGKQLAYDDAASRLPTGTEIFDVQYSSRLLPEGEMEVQAFIQTVEQIGVVQYH